MLSEPKKKSIWSLNPRGKYWSEDKTKIGQKLLESMGWREGFGLGKHNNGIKDHIRLNVNSDNKGLGYKPSADSVWVDKNDDYEQLLANLAVHHNNGSNKHEVKVSNLEETSKKLKNRLHKFIKSKNLSQCSEKDLVSIFPNKRHTSGQQRKNADQTVPNNCDEEVKKCENTFESTLNINDYFKSKMDKLNLKLKLNQTLSKKFNETDPQKLGTIDDNILPEDNTLQSKKRKSPEISENSDNSITDSNGGSKNEKQQKVKKKSKRNKEITDQSYDSLESSLNKVFEFQSIQQNIKKDKRKKHLNSKETEETDSQSSSDCSKKPSKRPKLSGEEFVTKVPKGYNSNNMSVFESLKNYHKIRDAIGRDKALSTTNLLTLKGYGCNSL